MVDTMKPPKEQLLVADEVRGNRATRTDNRLTLCYIADIRSPIAKNWIGHFVDRGHKVHVISTYRSDDVDSRYTSSLVVPVGFSNLAPLEIHHEHGSGGAVEVGSRLFTQIRSGSLSPFVTSLRNALAPLTLWGSVLAVRRIIAMIKPDLVHAMRIPFEGILSSFLPVEVPLVVSVWGNDFTLQACKNSLVSALTRRSMQRAHGVLCDCTRDVSLAREYGLSSSRPVLVLPGGGGIDTNLFVPATGEIVAQELLGVHAESTVVINPRGFRGYVRNDTFFRAIPHVLEKQPNAVFACCSMQGNPVAENWIRRYDISKNVVLLPKVPHPVMANLFRMALISVSPSLYDGTPNTLLESMACGCFPIAGDIDSIREWITHGRNGYLFDPRNHRELAKLILLALSDKQLLADAKVHNLSLIIERADSQNVIDSAEQFYRSILS